MTGASNQDDSESLPARVRTDKYPEGTFWLDMVQYAIIRQTKHRCIQGPFL